MTADPATAAPGVLSRPLAAAPVTIEAYARYDGSNLAGVLAVAGQHAETGSDGSLKIRAQYGSLHDLRPGHVVLRFGAGDCGVFSAGAFRRFYPDAEAEHG